MPATFHRVRAATVVVAEPATLEHATGVQAALMGQLSWRDREMPAVANGAEARR